MRKGTVQFFSSGNPKDKSVHALVDDRYTVRYFDNWHRCDVTDERTGVLYRMYEMPPIRENCLISSHTKNALRTVKLRGPKDRQIKKIIHRVWESANTRPEKPESNSLLVSGGSTHSGVAPVFYGESANERPQETEQ